MNIYDVAELTEVMATYWLSLDGWSANESTYLLLAIDPLKLESAVGFNGGKLEVDLPNQFDALEKLVTRAFKTGALNSHFAAPKDVIAWAMEKKLRLPALLIPAEMAVKDESGARKDYSVESEMALGGVRMTSDLPTFNMPARPTDVPQWLRDLPPDSGVQYINNVGGRNMHGPVEAKAVIEIVENVVARQATNFFTLNEAAQVLADSRPNLKALSMKDLMLKAWKDGKLPIREPGHNGPVSNARSISPSTDLVSVNDINAWLTSDGMEYQFPQAAQPLIGSQSGNANQNPWLIADPKDPAAKYDWYISARYFARQLVKADSTLLTKKDVLASKVVTSLSSTGFKKRGGAKNFDPATVKKAFTRVNLS
jgi:hypothetical protein